MYNSKYIEYVNSNEYEIAEYVNNCFEESRDIIREQLLSEITRYITPTPDHYEWRHNGCPYDISGEVFKSGLVSLNQTINSFLENEYNGNCEATYISGMGFRYNTYGDELCYVTMQIAADIMLTAIKRYIEAEFRVSLSDEDFEDIRIHCRDFDPIYDECLASDFFSYEPAVKFAGIGNIKLSNLLN